VDGGRRGLRWRAAARADRLRAARAVVAGAERAIDRERE
jgi:hypothetical protein